MKIVVSLIMVPPKFGEINCFSCPVERPPPPTESLKWYSPICDRWVANWARVPPPGTS